MPANACTRDIIDADSSLVIPLAEQFHLAAEVEAQVGDVGCASMQGGFQN